MGRRGPLPKAKDAEGRAIPGTVAVQAIPPPQVGLDAAPPPPAGLHPVALEAWRGFWQSDIAGFVDRHAHLPALHRWVRDVSMYHQVLEDLQKKPRAPRKGQPATSSRPWLSRGSRGQDTVHPSAELLNQLDQRIHRAEVEFGMTPYSGVRLFGAGVQGRLTAEQLDRLLAERSPSEPDHSSEPWAQGLQPAQ